MKSKIGLIVLIILVAVVAIVAVVVAAGGISLGGENKVTIMGTAYYNVVSGWGVTYDDSVVTEDGFFALLWYFPWETHDINILVEMDNGKTYSADCWAGKTNIISGSNAFSVELRHIPDGTYSGRIFVYEVEKGFLFGEKKRVLQATTNFRVTV